MEFSNKNLKAMTQQLLTLSFYALAVFLVIAPLIFHEMGHWAALRRFGVPVDQYWLGLGPALFKWGPFRVGMLPIGGAIVPRQSDYERLTPAQKIVVALAGPFASLIYGVVVWCAWLLNLEHLWAPAMLSIAQLNFLLVAINLLPIPPLDGFQALSNWLELRGRPLSPKAMATAQRAGSGLVYGFGFLILGLVFLN